MTLAQTMVANPKGSVAIAATGAPLSGTIDSGLFPADAAQSPASLPLLIELILKDRPRLQKLLRSTAFRKELAFRLLAISIASFVLFGVAMAVTLDSADRWPRLFPISEWIQAPEKPLIDFAAGGHSTRVLGSWWSGRAPRMIFAYAFGLIAATGVCLPSLYFYGLLSGVRMTMTEIVLHSLRAKATAGVALVGIVPVYVAIVLGAIVLSLPDPVVDATLLLGLILPFIAGFWGTRALYVGFTDYCTTMPAAFQKDRACFLRRLVLSWCVVYTAVAPVMIATVWRQLGG